METKSEIFPIRDPVKKVLFIPKLLLEMCAFWPEKRHFPAKLFNICMLLFCVFIESCQIAFVLANAKNITRLASAMSTVSTTFQAITKLSALFYYSSRLQLVVATIWHRFWPADTGTLQTYKNLKSFNTLVITTFLAMFVIAFLFAFVFFSAPLRAGNRVLPFEGIYPFPVEKSPLYEIFYVCEWLTNCAFILVGICGHDFLLLGICCNIVGQYILLKDVVSHLGTKNCTEKLSELSSQRGQAEDGNVQLLKICILHHTMLAKLGKEVSEIFSFSSFVQLFSSVTALCMGALLITFAEVDFAVFSIFATYFFGHLLQLFLFCSLGNEITDHASNFARSIFSSEWYSISDNRIKRDMLFMMTRAQTEVKISAMNIKALNYQTFIGVLRLSFSFYTMISNITNV